MEKHPLHIKNPELQTSHEVKRAVERKERQTGEKIPNDPSERIEAYMGRLEKIFLNPNERVRHRNLEIFQDNIYDALIIKRENFPESYFALQKRIAREQGHGDIEITPEMREQMIDTAIADQKASLDAWVDYLTEEDVAYPAWFKFYVWNQIIRLSQFDKQLGKFKSRTESTVGRFPDINPAALAKILDIYQKVKEDNRNLKEPEIKETFFKNFPALYAEFITESLASKVENKEEIRGKWIKYQADDPVAADQLYQSVTGKTGAAGWCVEGKATAESYNKVGDFYIYYTNDKYGNPVQPRLAIQMNGNQIGQIRGILVHQEVEPIMQETLDDKLAEFGSEADIYRKKSEDMKLLTALERKNQSNEPLTKKDLAFLYEINSEIEGFGYQKDPRINELRKDRNTEADMLTVFDCTKEQVAHNVKEVSKTTRAYVGEWNPEVCQKIKDYPQIQHIFESFPEKKVFRLTLETNPQINSPEVAIRILKERNYYLSNWGGDILKKTKFSQEKQSYELVRFTVAQLGFPRGATTADIYQKAKKLGLDLCPAEVGPHLRLQYSGWEWMLIAMKQISDRYGGPYVFGLSSHGVQLVLYGSDARSDYLWGSGSQFVFRLRK